MTKDDFQLLFAYDRWANNRVLHATFTLSTENFTRDLGGSFRSVRDTLVHIIGGEWIWLAYWNDPPDTPERVEQLRKRRDALFPPASLPDVSAVHSKWAEVESEQIAFVNQMTDERLQNLLPFRTTKVRLAHLMQHWQTTPRTIAVKSR